MNSPNISGSISVIDNNINSDHIDVSENTGVISVPGDEEANTAAAKEEDFQEDSGGKKSKKHKKKVQT